MEKCIIVAIADEATARMSEFLSALRISPFLKSSTYHLKENPLKDDVLEPELKEKKMRVAIGANKNTRMRAI